MSLTPECGIRVCLTPRRLGGKAPGSPAPAPGNVSTQSAGNQRPIAARGLRPQVASVPPSAAALVLRLEDGESRRPRTTQGRPYAIGKSHSCNVTELYSDGEYGGDRVSRHGVWTCRHVVGSTRTGVRKPVAPCRRHRGSSLVRQLLAKQERSLQSFDAVSLTSLQYRGQPGSYIGMGCVQLKGFLPHLLMPGLPGKGSWPCR